MGRGFATRSEAIERYGHPSEQQAMVTSTAREIDGISPFSSFCPRTSQRTAAKRVGRAGQGDSGARLSVTTSVISANGPHLTGFYRVLSRRRSRPCLRLHPLCTAVHGVRLREGRPVKGQTAARAANGAVAKCYADIRSAAIAAAAIGPPTAAGVIQATFVRVGIDSWVQVALVLRAKPCTQDIPEQVCASQTRAIEERLEMSAILTSLAAFPALVDAEGDHNTTGPSEEHARGRP